MRVTRLGALVLLCFPAAASAVLTIDDVRWPETGAYPAYPEALSAAATGRRFHAFVYGGLYRDSNLFRLPSGANPKSVNFNKLGVGLRADLPISRQRVLLEAQMDENRYRDFGSLDNTGGRASATWNWEVGNNWQGNLGASTERALTGFGQIQTAAKDMVTQDRVFGSAGYRVTPDWRVRVGAYSYRLKHSDTTHNVLDSEQTDGIVGVDYVTPLQNSIGLQVRYSRGDFPNFLVTGGTTVDSHYKETEPSAVVHYNLGGKSSIDARLGVTRHTQEDAPSRDFKGTTGNLAFHWTPTPKTILDLTAYKETRPYVTGSVGSFLSAIESTSAYVVARGVTFAPHWAITDQVVLQAQLLEERDTYQGDPSIVLLGTPEREDKLRAASVSAGWSPLRPLLLSLSYERGKRTSNIANADYDYNAVSANAKYTFF